MENTDQSSVSAKPAAGGAAPAGGGGGKEKVEKQARQLAYDTRYKVRQTMSQQSGGKADPAAVRKAYMAQLGKSPAPPAVKARAKQMLLGENVVNVEELLSKNVSSAIEKIFEKHVVTNADKVANTPAWKKYKEGDKNYTAASHVKEDVIEEDKGEKTFKVRVTDKKTNNSYVRNATRDKIRELRANPNISSVEMTEYGEPTRSEKHKGSNTAAVKSGKGDEVAGKDHSIDLKKEDYSSLKSENFDGFLELVEKSKDEKKGKITGEGVNNNKLVKVFPDDVKEESDGPTPSDYAPASSDNKLKKPKQIKPIETPAVQARVKEEKLEERVGGAGTLVRQGVKVGGKKGGRAVQKGQAQAIAAGQGAKEAVKGGNPNKMVGSGKFEKAGAVVGGVGGALAGGVLDGPLPVGDIVGGIAGGKVGGKIGRQFDKIGAKKPVEEEYDNTKSPDHDKKVAKLRDKLSKRGITDKKEQDKHPQISEEDTSGSFYKFDVGNPAEIKKNMQNANKGKFQKIGAKDSKTGLDVTMNDKGETGLSYSEQMDPVVEATLQNLEELKTSTLRSYANRASVEAVGRGVDAGIKGMTGPKDEMEKNMTKAYKRQRGINRAVNKLASRAEKAEKKEEFDPVVAATLKNLDEIVGATLGTVAGAKFLPKVLADVGLKGALAGKVAGGALGAAAGEVIDPLKKGKDKNPVSAAVGGAAGTAAHGAIKGALQKSSYEPKGKTIEEETRPNYGKQVSIPLPGFLKNFQIDLPGSHGHEIKNGQVHSSTKFKSGLSPTGEKNVEKFKGEIIGGLKDKAVKAGKAVAPVAGGLGVGIAAKKITDKVMGHGVKEDTDYGDDQKEVAPGTVCFDDGAALPATIKPIGDPREMSTALNLIKNKWRAKGLKMSYEPKGDHLGEDATKNGKVKLKPKYKVEEGKLGAGVTGTLGNIVGGTVGGAVGGPAGAAVGRVAGGALGASAAAKKGKKKSAAIGGALGSPFGAIGSGVGGVIGASNELEGEVIDEAQSSYDKARKAAARRAADRNAARRRGELGGRMERETYTSESGKRMHYKGYSANENEEVKVKGDLVDEGLGTALGGAVGGPLGAAGVGAATGGKKGKKEPRRVKKALGAGIGAAAGQLVAPGPAGLAAGGYIGGKIANSYEPEGDVVQEADSLSGQVSRWEAARQKRMKQRQSYERPHWIPRDQDHEDNWGSSKGEKPKPQKKNANLQNEGHSAVSSALSALDSYMESSKHLHGSIIAKKN